MAHGVYTSMKCVIIIAAAATRARVDSAIIILYALLCYLYSLFGLCFSIEFLQSMSRLGVEPHTIFSFRHGGNRTTRKIPGRKRSNKKNNKL